MKVELVRIPSVPPRSTVTLMIVLACAWAVLDLLELAARPGSVAALREAAATGFLSSQASNLSLQISEMSWQVQVGALVATSWWIHHGWLIAEALAPGSQATRREWITPSWALPLVNVVVPFRIMIDLWITTTHRPATKLVWWWTAWASWQLLDIRKDLFWAEVVAAVAMVAALGLWISIVVELAQAQRATGAAPIRPGRSALSDGPSRGRAAA